MGYKVVDKELFIDAVSAETVKTIFILKNDRNTNLREIAGYLNSNGIATARGGNWHAGTVKYVLDNPIYQGIVAYAGVKANNAELTLISEDLKC